MGFPTKNDHFVVFWGYHHFRKNPYLHKHLKTCQTEYWTPPHKSGAKPRWFWRSTGHPPPALAKTRMQSSFKELPGHVTFRELQGCWENPTELQQFGGLFILLMVQKSQGQPPRMVLKPCKSWDFNYQPQLVSWSRISCCHQQCDTKPKNALTIFAILILPKITRDSLYQV